MFDSQWKTAKFVINLIIIIITIQWPWCSLYIMERHSKETKYETIGNGDPVHVSVYSKQDISQMKTIRVHKKDIKRVVLNMVKMRLRLLSRHSLQYASNASPKHRYVG